MSNLCPALCAATALACALASPAFAQNPKPAASTAAPPSLNGLEAAQPNSRGDSDITAAGQVAEVVVTARRREESLQSAPVTVNVFTGAQLQARGITDIRTLVQATPGVNFDALPRAAPRPYFRGIGSSNQGAGGDPSSVAFLDGVYLGRAAMLGIDFYDMQRVEVLKGPQGTLFGKNVVGGALNFITAKPVAEAQGTAQFTAATFGQLNGDLMLNAALNDSIATRIVLGAITNDGFRRTPDGKPLDDENKYSGRIQTLFGMGSPTTVLLSADASGQKLAQNARYNVRVLPFRATGGDKGYDDFDSPRVGNPDRPGGIVSDTGGVRGEIVNDSLSFATVTATAAWRTLTFRSSEDFDGTTAAQNALDRVAVSGIQIIQNEDADSYSGELRFNSKASGPFTWVAGFYWNQDDISRVRESQTSVTPTTINQYTGVADNRSFAGFGELQYRFDFGLGVFGGLRYTDERKEYEVTRLTGPRAAPVINYTTVGTPGVSQQNLVTYRVGADYRLNRNIFVFGSVSTGFKSGAFQEQPGNAVLARIPTAPEKVINYEAGVKTDLLDRRLRFNVSVFHADYSDLQTIQVVPDATAGPGGTRVSTDTGDATINGVEAEAVFAPVRWFDVTARYAYLDATFDRLTQTSAILANGTAVFRDLAGNRLSRTPEHAVNVDLGVTSPRYGWGSLRGVVNVDYTSEIFDDNDNDFIEYRRPRALLNASLTYNVNDRYSVQGWIRNLTDETYRIHQTDTAGGLFVVYGPPRQVGVTLNARF